MRKIVLITMLSMIIGGCSDMSPVAVKEEVLLDRISPEEVIAIADRSDDLSEESLWIVSSIGARLLVSKLDQYIEAGYTEADFGRMPDNELTANLKRLYSDMKLLND